MNTFSAENKFDILRSKYLLINIVNLVVFFSFIKLNASTFNILNFGAETNKPNNNLSIVIENIVNSRENNFNHDTIFFPIGIYYIYENQGGAIAYSVNFDQRFNNLTFLGENPEKTIVKLMHKISHENERNFIFFYTQNFSKISNFKVENIQFDGELLKSKKYKLNNYALSLFYIPYAENIEFKNNIFQFNPGRQVLMLGKFNTKKLTSRVIKLINNKFISNGDFFKDKEYMPKDHSTIYITGSNIIISNNILLHDSVSISETSTAIELHTSNAKVFGNYVKNYNTAINICADKYMNSINNSIYNNVFLKNNTTLMFWNNLGYFDNTIFDNNYIERNNSPLADINVSSAVNTEIKSIKITSNNFTNDTLQNNKSYCQNLIIVGNVKNIIVNKNRFNNIKGRVISLGKIESIHSFEIIGNTFNTNYIFPENADCKAIIEFKTIGEIKNLTIDNNIFNITNEIRKINVFNKEKLKVKLLKIKV